MPKLVMDADALVELTPISGEIPSPLSPPKGCHFNPRCPRAVDRCHTDDPELESLGPDHVAACHLAT